MARTNEVNVVVGAKDKTKAGLKSAKSGVEGLGNSIKTLAGAWLGFQGLRAGVDLIKLGAKAEQTERAFDNLATKVGMDSKQILKDLRRAAGGTVSELQLMQQAAASVNLGLPLEKLAGMMEIARASAAATGQSVQFMFQSIVLGTARQSRLILDNLGIIISETAVYKRASEELGRALTDVEKRQAFLNEVLRKGQDIISNVGDATDGVATQIQVLEADFENFKAEMGKMGAEVIVETDALSTLSDGLLAFGNIVQLVVSTIGGLRSAIFDTQVGVVEFILGVDNLDKTFQQLNGTLPETKKKLEAIVRIESPLGISPEVIAENMTLITSLANHQITSALRVRDAITKFGEQGFDSFRNILQERIDLDNESFERQSGQSDDMLSIAMRNLKKETVITKQQYNIQLLERKKMTKVAESLIMASTQAITNATYAMADSITESLWGARSQAREVFKALAKDFVRLFINEALKALAAVFVVKMVKILASIFDTRANDLLAMEQGQHYAQFFTAGMVAELGRFDLGRNISDSLGAGNTLTTSGSLIQSSGQRTINNTNPAPVNITITGDIIGEDEYVRKKILPSIERAIQGRFTSLEIANG